MHVPVGDLEKPCAEHLRALLSGHEEALHLSVDEVDSLCFNPNGPHPELNFDMDRFVHSMKMFSESFKQLASVQVSGATGRSVPPVSDADKCPKANESLGLKQSAGGKVTSDDNLMRPCHPTPYRALKKECQTRQREDDNKSELAAVTTKSTVAKVGFPGIDADQEDQRHWRQDTAELQRPQGVLIVYNIR
ncbi:hypothetical protein SARC_00921 [Sphaeroforma arctica JP610]|uniref:Uncharacterized protein n=1 Tax=Sphaeroforma arctica JP610 TaxID=667725 RepID=A0A0L0GDK2_9EUKA|nr:hypothetical protein SARC_00921 [Sphaeroforma arctica JP610]KNC86971.1 hypothetical protein SARC_00921 [Sphaeroforma arctica JP610]|eukprot:XP_014160873.1 hypothetical protein SARC_00921 [Sphaeroforma arctica JP610]